MEEPLSDFQKSSFKSILFREAPVQIASIFERRQQVLEHADFLMDRLPSGERNASAIGMNLYFPHID